MTPMANLPLVSMTPVATDTVGVVDTGGKFATVLNDTGGIYWEQYQTADILK